LADQLFFSLLVLISIQLVHLLSNLVPLPKLKPLLKAINKPLPSSSFWLVMVELAKPPSSNAI
jgi:hypothetical protein